MDLQYLRDHYRQMSPQDQQLACDLAAKFKTYGSWTEKQIALVRSMISRAGRPAPKAMGDLSKIQAMFDLASKKSKYPAVILEVDGAEIKINRAGEKSRYPGSINVASRAGGYHEGVFYGRIGTDGAWRGTPSADALPNLLPFLERFAADPAAVALEYGRETGHCCFCAKELDDPVSVAVGYGPTCAKKWGLPHNKGAAANARA